MQASKPSQKTPLLQSKSVSHVKQGSPGRQMPESTRLVPASICIPESLETMPPSKTGRSPPAPPSLRLPASLFVLSGSSNGKPASAVQTPSVHNSFCAQSLSALHRSSTGRRRSQAEMKVIAAQIEKIHDARIAILFSRDIIRPRYQDFPRLCNAFRGHFSWMWLAFFQIKRPAPQKTLFFRNEGVLRCRWKESALAEMQIGKYT